MSERAKKNQGMNWIAPPKRLALYLRDGLACCYCGATLEDGCRLTLDHLIPHSLGGGNDTTNLVTACLICNSSRGARSVKQFAKKAAAYLNHGITTRQILAHIRATTRRPFDIAAAKDLIARRGGFSAALRSQG